MKLENNEISIEIDQFGAELKSIKKGGIEYLWQGDPEFWKRSSPVLFPIVGRLLDDEYTFEDKMYKMTQHGFARDHVFTVVRQDEKSCQYLLSDNQTTLTHYPFHFDLLIGYELKGNEVLVSWEVINKSDTNMYFQIGAHPAFNFLNGSIIEVNKHTNKYEFEGTPYVQDVTTGLYVKNIEICDNTFAKDALVYDNIDCVTLKDSEKSVSIYCEGFPFLGLWSSVKNKQNAPFICIEPWYGIADCSFHDKELTSKKGMNVLNPKDRFKASYRIIIK